MTDRTDKPSAAANIAGEKLAQIHGLLRQCGYDFDEVHPQCYRNFSYIKFYELTRPPVAGAEVADEGSLLSEASKRYPQLGGSHRVAFIEGARWAASVLADSYDPEINIKAATALSPPVAERGGGE